MIQLAIEDLAVGFSGNKPTLTIDIEMYSFLSAGIFLKFLLWILCSRIAKSTKSDMVGALGEDHFNDVISNSMAIATVTAAANTSYWYIDPIGAIIISLLIVYRWLGVIYEQVKKIVGYTAPPEFIEQLEKMAVEHDARLEVDSTRVYHFGARCKSFFYFLLNLSILIVCNFH